MKFTSLADPLQSPLSVLVGLQLRNDDFAGLDTERDALAIRFFSCNSFDMNEVFQPVDGRDFSFSALVGASYNGDFVISSDRHASDL